MENDKLVIGGKESDSRFILVYFSVSHAVYRLLIMVYVTNCKSELRMTLQ